MNAKIKKYVISGNLDEKETYDKIIENTGFKNLNNDYDLIYNTNFKTILFTGLEEENMQENLNQISNKLQETNKHQDIAYTVLLTHKPDSIEQIEYEKFDLILSGHSLNGQVNIPIYGPLIKLEGSKKFYKEHYQFDNTQLYISRGIGTLNNNIRLFNKPAINLYRLAPN